MILTTQMQDQATELLAPMMFGATPDEATLTQLRKLVCDLAAESPEDEQLKRDLLVQADEALAAVARTE